MESSRSSGRLKQRLAHMFKASSVLRSACNSSTSAATILSSTASSRTLLHDVAREPVFVPRHHRHRGVDDDGMFLAHNGRHHMAPVLRLAIDICGGCRPTGDLSPLMAKNDQKGRRGKNKKILERRVRETGGFYVTGEGEGRMCPPASPSSPSKSSYYYYCFNEVEKEEKKLERNKKKKKKEKKKLLSNSHGISSSSSMNSDDGFEFFTSEEGEGKEEEETEYFFSSRSFSSDSSEFYQRPMPNIPKKKKKKNEKASRCPPRRRSKNHENRNASEGFRPLVSITSRKKVKELEEEKTRGFAVVKRSSDPYGDFRSSMVEMIIGRQIFEAEDLERLLHAYLSLNSPQHHPIILQAFSDIWVVLFGN